MIPVLAISLQPLAFFTILARPVTRQNLSCWRLGGCQEWLAHQDLLALVAQQDNRRHPLPADAPRPTPNCAQLCLIKLESGKNAPKQGIFSRPNHDINP
jgi:hypothetical protein